MTMRLALTQAPHPSYWNGGLAQTSRQYWLRPTQKPFAPVNIDTLIAGMAPNERRVISTLPTATLAAYDATTGSGYGITDWTPFCVFDETTQQIIHGGKRRTNKVVLWSAVTGEWRQERMERIPTDFYVGGHWYGMTAKNGDNHLLHDRTYNPETQSWSARIPGLPAGPTTYIYLPNYGTGGGWLWGSETMTVHDIALGTNTTLGTIGHTGGHELKVYHPLHDKVLAVGGSDYPTKTTLIDGTTGAFESRAACPANIHMAGTNDETSTAIAHPSGCWLFVSSFPAPRRVWAYWPNADVWQEVAELPLLAAYTYPTTAWDADRQIAYELSGSSLYAWKLPDVTDPYGGGLLAAAGVSVSTGSAAPSVDIALSAIGLSVSSGTALLSGAAAGELSAAGQAGASGSAGVVANVSIAASGLAQAAATAGLSGDILLAGAGAAQASGNATLAAQLAALAQGAAQASGTASITATSDGSLLATGAATASGAAALVLEVRLQGAGSATASGSGALSSGTQADLQAGGSAQASGAATLRAELVVTAAGFVQAMGAGHLRADVELAAFGGATASGTAVISSNLVIADMPMPAFVPSRRICVIPALRRLLRVPAAPHVLRIG